MLTPKSSKKCCCTKIFKKILSRFCKPKDSTEKLYRGHGASASEMRDNSVSDLGGPEDDSGSG
ncbi:MAG: hypothetical protein V4487_03110, partial [Chlamydiota bacterium]